MKFHETPTMNPEIDIARANIAMKELPTSMGKKKEKGNKSIKNSKTVPLEVISE